MTLSGILRSAVGALCIAAAAGCGGSGDTVEPFAPTGIVAFGDELSFLAPGGRKYSVNALEDDGSISCDTYPLWTQVVARDFGMKFETDPCLEVDEVAKGRIFATPGAKVADVATQVDAFLVTATPTSIQLALMWAGVNDILELYGQYPAQTESALAAQAATRGKALAEQANRVGLSGHPVVLVTMADMGLSPFARTAGIDAQRVLSVLSREFNSAIHVNLLQDGRRVGIVFGEAEMQNATEVPSSYGYENVLFAACVESAPLPTCTTDTMVLPDLPATSVDEGVNTAVRSLWADATRPGPSFQSRIGSLVLTRARNNPF
jgi:outer membrane lipase/esterase